jgi:hypothetical protein
LPKIPPQEKEKEMVKILLVAMELIAAEKKKKG